MSKVNQRMNQNYPYLTTVHNMRHLKASAHKWNDETDIYIGRVMPALNLQASPFANPFRIGKDGDRKQVLSNYRRHLAQLLRSQPNLRNLLDSYKGKRLWCWCAPLDCHGDILVEWIELFAKEYWQRLEKRGAEKRSLGAEGKI